MATRPTPSPHAHAAAGGSPNTNDGAVPPRTELPLLAEPLLTADDVASLLRVPRSTVYELTAKSSAPARQGRAADPVRAQ